MAITQNTYTGDGTTVLFSFTFPYLETTDIKVSLNGLSTTAYTLANATTIQFNTAPANGVAIRIYRETDDSALAATFYPGSAIRSNDLNENFTQNLYVTQEAINYSVEAVVTADGAVTTANTATTTANTALSTANTASTNASAAVATANTASTDASAAVSTANTASSNATAAVNTANSAASDAATALSTANTALSTANTADTNASTALSTANTAASDASTAVTTANTASTDASAAVSTANTASSNATSAVSTANSALSTANAAASAVANAILYDIVANVAAIPSSPANNDAVEVTDSTGIESFTPLNGLPVGFVGDSGLSVRLVYTTTGSTWNWIQYFPNDPEARYGDQITTNTSDISTVQGDVTTLQGDVTTLQSDVTTLQSDVLGLDNNKLNLTGGTMTGDVTLNAQADLRFADSDSSNWVALHAPATVASNITLTLPDTNGSANQFLKNGSTAGTLGWSSMVEDASGRVGVGTASPGALFSLGTSTANQKLLVYDDTANKTLYGLGMGSGEMRSFAASNGVLTFGHVSTVDGTTYTERARITSDGKLGLGTSTPEPRLDVQAASAAVFRAANPGVAQVYVGFAGGSSNYYDADNQYFRNGAGSATRLVIDSSGRVGVGTASPSENLSIAGGANLYASLTSTGGIKTALAAADANGFGWVGTTTNHSFSFFANNTERARIDRSGRLLVGTSTALTATDVSKSKFVVNGDTDGSGYPGRIALNNSVATVLANYKLGELYFTGQAAGNAAASIACYAESNWNTAGDPTDNPGYLVFSTTADGASSPTERMRIASNGDFGFNTPVIGGEGGISIVDGSAGARQFYWKRASTTSTSYPLSFNNGSTNVGFVSFTNTATSYVTSSDYRLKENVTAVTDGIARLQQLKPSRFNFIADPATTVDGFLAHEVQTVVPEAITGEKDAVDDKGNPVYQGIDQSKLVPLLTAALQEAIGEIESLKARVAALETP